MISVNEMGKPMKMTPRSADQHDDAEQFGAHSHSPRCQA